MVEKSDDRRTPTARPGATPLMVFYGACAVAGAIVPWYFNIRHMRESGELLTPQAWVAGGFINPLTGSITSDFLIGTTPVLVWMVIESRRLGMRHAWFYVVTTFLVAFAFACPLFLLMRETRIRDD
jgi:Terpene cyclase DEP1